MCVAPVPADTWRQDPDYGQSFGMMTANQAALLLWTGLSKKCALAMSHGPKALLY